MANQNVNLGTFNFDTDSLSRQLAELRSQMQSLNVNIKEMRNEANKTAKELTNTANKMAELSAVGEDGSEEFEKLNAEFEELGQSLIDQNQLLEEAEGSLRAVNREYKETSNVLRAVTDAENNYVSAKERTNQLLNEEVTSIASARQSNKDILALRNQLNPAIAEEAKLIEELNNRLDQNNEFIKNNASAYERQKINIGNYADSVKDALQTLESFPAVQKIINTAMDQEIKNTEDLKNQIKELSGIRDQLNIRDEKHAALIGAINKRIEENKTLIKEQTTVTQNQLESTNDTNQRLEGLSHTMSSLNNSFLDFVFNSSKTTTATEFIVSTFNDLRNSLIGMTRAALAFIATPIGAAITALAGIGLVAKEFFDYNNSVKESIRLTEQFTGIAGSAGDAIRVQAQAISDTFGADFEEVLVTAQKLVQNFGISYDEALNIIKEGLAEGGVANKEFFDSLKEYPVFFKQAGYSAQEFKDIVNTGFDLGIYNDKLPDAIKEAGISLQEQTKSTRDALVNAFGASFTDDILKRVRTGQTSVKDALNEIAKESEKVNLNQQQLATLTADVFRGAGEDVGGAVKIFEALNVAQQEANKTLSETEQYYLDLANANEELAKAKDEAFKSDSLISFTQQFELMWTKVQTAFYQAVGWAKDIYVEYNRVIGTSESLQKIWTNISELGQKIGSFVDRMKVSFQQLASSIGLSGGETNKLVKYLSYAIDPIKKIELIVTALNKGFRLFSNVVQSATIDLTALVRTAKQAYESITNLDFSNLANIGKMFMDNRKEVSQDIVLAESRNKAIESFINLNKEVMSAMSQTSKITKDNVEQEKKDTKDLDKERQKAFDNEIRRMQERIDLFRSEQGFAKKSLEDQLEIERRVAKDSIAILDKELLNKKISREKYQAGVNKINTELASREAEIVIQNAMDEVEAWRMKNQSKLESDKIWNDQSVALEKQRLEELLQLQNDYEKTRLLNGQITEREYQANILANGIETQNKINEIDSTYEAQRTEQDLAKAEADFEAKILRMQEEGAQAWEIEQEMRDNQYQMEIDKLNERYEAGLIREDVYQQELSNIEKKWNLENNRFKEELQQKELESRLSFASSMLSIMGDAIGKETEAGKALGIAQVGINTAMAIMKSYSDLGPIMGSIFAVVMGTVGALQIKKIASTKKPKVDTNLRGHASGGMIYKNSGIPIQRRPNGDNMLVSVYDGEAILNPTQQSLIGHDVLRMAGVPGFASGGMVGSTSPIVQSQVINQINQMELTETISEAVKQGAMEGSALGSASGSQEGIKGLNTDLEIQRRATF